MLAEKIFAEGVARQIMDYLPPEYQGMKCQVTEKVKNNGVCMAGITIYEPDEKMSRIIYMDAFYDEIKKGKPMQGVLEEIAEQIKDSREYGKELEGVKLEEFSYAKPYLMISLINTNANRRMLNQMPHIEIEDLSMICQIKILSPKKEVVGTAKVTNDLLKVWEISKSQLFDEALANVQDSKSYVIRTMEEMLEETLPGYLLARGTDNLENSNPPIGEQVYVLSNKEKQWGASAMLCSSMMENVSRIFPEGFYILPSSVHEVIIISKNASGHAWNLGEIVRGVNEMALAKEDILSNCVYEYDKSRGQIRQVSESLERGWEIER